MSSKALEQYNERLTEVDQLIDAHGALIRLRNAEERWRTSTQKLDDVADVIKHLVSEPGPGRPREVHALNSAAIALLSGHLQGFIADIFAESAKAMLDGKIKDLCALLDSAPARGNPNEQNITRLFATIGFPDILSGVTWQRVGTSLLKRKLKDFNELRNRIVHGSSEHVTKQQIRNYAKFWKSFGSRFDEKLRQEIEKVTGTSPW